ncbi:MAG: DUF5947 family protein [Streptosporangiales bacterium]
MTSGALERVIRRAGAQRAAAAEHCDLCSDPVRHEHRHVFDSERREVMCACQACSLLFAQDAASRGHFRLLPQRRVRLPRVSTKVIGAPVGLAFFVKGKDGDVLAHYPSPLGTTDWEVDQEAWQEVAEQRPELATLQPEVEALLVNTARDTYEHWIVPLDDCFRLVAVVREHWRGLSGGDRVWEEIKRFFAELEERR